ncbi:MAG TPA: AMP-binding protein [Candidatus Nanopelagicales bacterium]|nr:AMP-binding protein [Candidatus Nanopelagicales bacterium]
MTGIERFGISAGDRVVVRASNSAEVLEFVLACLRAGIAPALISPSTTEREVREMTSDIQAASVMDDAALSRMVDIDDIPTSGAITCRPLHFTSGTSGRPKAVWSAWWSPQTAAQWVEDETSAWGMTGDDVHLVCGPLNHSAPLRFALMTLLAGGSVIVPPAFDPATVISAMEQHGVTTSFMAPAHLQRLRDHVGAGPIAHRMRLLAHAGSACPDAVRVWAHETFGLDVVQEFYGSTEGQFTQCTASEWVERPGTVGRARPGRQMRVDEDGLLWCKPPAWGRFSYWDDPDKTAGAWDGDWFTVGDYGRIDADGYVYLHGRRGDLIISGGVNVYPAEIERVLANLPGVQQVVAFGVPDETWGQRVCVAIGGDVSEDQVRAFVGEQLSGAKKPKSVFVASSLPTTHSGKVDRVATVALFA